MNYFLTVNAGSSSIKCALFAADSLEKRAEASVVGIGFETATFKSGEEAKDLGHTDHFGAMQTLLKWLKNRNGQVVAIGHRIVHGGPQYHESCMIDDEVVENLRTLIPFDREHLPAEIQLVEQLREAFPEISQVACFDTAFHHDLPTEARLLPIPRKYEEKGLRRYGFHGLSYTYLLQELQHVDAEAAKGRVIFAHLGNGASLAAVKDGQPVDTSMSLTPNSGVVMSTRSGDLDPGLVAYLAEAEGMKAEQFSQMASFESGLLGVSGTTSDMKQLLDTEATDPKAAEAVNLFCYEVKKCIGAYAAALGGLDTLVFSGGIGEPAPKIRARVCAGLEFLGIRIDQNLNEQNAEVISAPDSSVTVRIMHTEETITIARDMARLIKES